MSDPQDDITAFWSTVASGYDAHPGNVPAPGSDEHEQWVALVAGVLPDPPADVLDVATGTGFLAGIAASLGHRVTGIDLAAPMLDEARRGAPEVRFELGDAVDPPFDPASFDAVTSRHLLWTLREPAAAFARWRALLRPGGRIVAIDGFWFDEEPDLYASETRAQLPFLMAKDPGVVVEALERAGFADVTATRALNVHVIVAR